jgi:hypothetical protein
LKKLPSSWAKLYEDRLDGEPGSFDDAIREAVRMTG